jgi:hypothetical protein
MPNTPPSIPPFLSLLILFHILLSSALSSSVLMAPRTRRARLAHNHAQVHTQATPNENQTPLLFATQTNTSTQSQGLGDDVINTGHTDTILQSKYF